MNNLSISDINDRFQIAFKAVGLSQKEFASRIGLSQNQISTILKGKSNITSQTIQLLRYVFRINPEYIFKGSLPMFLSETKLSIPIISDIPSGKWEIWFDNYKPGINDGYIELSDIKGSNLFAVRVPDDSMEPSLSKGNILIVNPAKKFTRGIAVVRHTWGYKIRNVKQHDKFLLLMPINPKYDEEEILPDENTAIYVPVKAISIKDI